MSVDDVVDDMGAGARFVADGTVIFGSRAGGHTRGIKFATVRADFATQNVIPVMRISGRMHNVSDQDRRLFAIRLSLLDDAGQEIYHWTTDAGQPALQAGSNLPFQYHRRPAPVVFRCGLRMRARRPASRISG